MLAPEGEDVGLDGAARWAIVIEAGDAAVDLERRLVEQPPVQRVHHRLPERLPLTCLLYDVHFGCYDMTR